MVSRQTFCCSDRELCRLGYECHPGGGDDVVKVDDEVNNATNTLPEETRVLSSDDESSALNPDQQEAPLADFAGEFVDDVAAMLAMGLPLGFRGAKGQSVKVNCCLVLLNNMTLSGITISLSSFLALPIQITSNA